MVLSHKSILIGSSFITALTVYGTMYPIGIPVFSLANLSYSFIVLIYLFLKKRIVIGNWFGLYLMLALTYLISLLLSGNIYKPNFYDIFNIINFFILFNILHNILNENDNFDLYTNYCQILFIVFSVILAAVGLMKFGLLLNGIKISYFYRSIGTYPWGTSLISDYNVFGLGLVLGLISTHFCFQRSKYFYRQSILVTCATIITVCIIFSGSRRAWMILLFYLAFLLAAKVPNVIIMLMDFRVNKALLKSIVMIVFLSLGLMVVINLFPSIISISHKHHLVSMRNRFVGIKDHLLKERISGSGDRIELLEHSSHIFENYDLKKTIFGNGGQYMIELGSKFKEKDRFGKPHNMIVSSFLQSGIAGGILTIFFFFFSFFQYIKNYHASMFKYFFFLFLITSFFSITSANTIFTKKIFILLIFLPWIVKSGKTHIRSGQ